jgi:hypothetical protein
MKAKTMLQYTKHLNTITKRLYSTLVENILRFGIDRIAAAIGVASLLLTVLFYILGSSTAKNSAAFSYYCFSATIIIQFLIFFKNKHRIGTSIINETKCFIGQSSKTFDVPKYFALVILFLISTVSLTWFENDKLLIYGDYYFSPPRSKTFYNAFYAWQDSSFGNPSYQRIVTIFPDGIFHLLTEFIGLPLLQSQKLFLFISFFLMGYSMYLLSVQTLRIPYKRLAGIIAGLFYMFNPWSAESLAVTNMMES